MAYLGMELSSKATSKTTPAPLHTSLALVCSVYSILLYMKT